MSEINWSENKIRVKEICAKTILRKKKKMLKEFKKVRQIDGEHFRKWFHDNYFNLIIWYDQTSEIIGFQLCYDIHQNEHAITWGFENGFRHELVDNGEQSVVKNMAPILIQDGKIPIDSVIENFAENNSEIDQDIFDYVMQRLKLIKTDYKNIQYTLNEEKAKYQNRIKPFLPKKHVQKKNNDKKIVDSSIYKSDIKQRTMEEKITAANKLKKEMDEIRKKYKKKIRF